MAGTKTVILGGGVGGIVLANALRARLPKEHKIILIERAPTFHMGAAKTWVMLGERNARQVSTPLSRLKRRGIDVVQATIRRIDVAERAAETDHGRFQGDFLVIALGADYAMDSVPGLSEAAHTFYTLSGSERMRSVWKEFDGGDVVVLISRAPFKCPPAPYEAAMLLQHDLQRRGLAGKARIHLYTLEGTPMATAGPEMGAYIRKSLEERGIGFHPLKRTRSVDAGRKVVTFEDGSEARYDLLVAVPPHVAPQCVRDSGLTNAAGWIPVDPKSLRLASGPDGVYAVGDVTVVPLPGRFKPDSPLVLPKAGVFAQGQALTVASHIAAEVEKKGAGEPYAGKGFCYIEVGDRHAVRGDGSFFELPHPKMTHGVPDLMQYEQKRQWVDDMVKENLG
jgi:sulfide:quinone oxidoreductase